MYEQLRKEGVLELVVARTVSRCQNFLGKAMGKAMGFPVQVRSFNPIDKGQEGTDHEVGVKFLGYQFSQSLWVTLPLQFLQHFNAQH